MKRIRKKKTVKSIPKMNHHAGFTREQWEQLNAGKTIEVDVVPEQGDPYVTKGAKDGD